jgi:hypothetical protein
MKIVVAFFFGFMSVARFSMHVALFIDLGSNAAAAVGCCVLIRWILVFRRYTAYFEKHWGEVSFNTYIYIFTVGWIDVFLSYFFTIATDDEESGRLENDRLKVILTITGPLEKATVTDKVLSQPALCLLCVHITEILIGWLLVLGIGATSTTAAGNPQGADVGLWYALVWGLAPVALALLALLCIWALPKRGESGDATTAGAAVSAGDLPFQIIVMDCVSNNPHQLNDCC